VIKIALSKGRILQQTLPLLAQLGIVSAEDLSDSRKLIVDTTVDDIQLVILRATDVPTFVQFGAADIGVVGKDVLLEHGGDGLYELLDLGIARCRMVVAEPRDMALNDDPGRWRRLRIATKYVNTTRRFFAAKGVQTEIIKLYGSMELAPLSGLADRIVDLVDSGATLRANNLLEVEHIADISSRLVANKVSMKLLGHRIKPLLADLARISSQAATE
jgi:ATP phosphoribosyltransferase